MLGVETTHLRNLLHNNLSRERGFRAVVEVRRTRLSSEPSEAACWFRSPGASCFSVPNPPGKRVLWGLVVT